MRSFRDVSTSTKGKKSLEKRIYPLFREICNENEIILALCGSPDGIYRHLYRYYECLKCPYKNIYFVERDWQCYLALKDFIEKKGLNCNVIFGDIIEVAHQFTAARKKIFLIDFDGTDSLSKEHLNFIGAFETRKMAKFLLLVASGRGPSSKTIYLEEITDMLKLKRIRKQIFKRKIEQTESDKKVQVPRKTVNDGRPRAKDILIEYVKAFCTSENLFTSGYKGRSNMVAILLRHPDNR